MTATATALTFIVKFLFNEKREAYLSIEARYENEPISLDLSSLSMFLFKHERVLDKKEADFCYSLGKFLRKVNWGNQLILAIPHEDDIALFFKRAYESGVQLHWAHRGQNEPIFFNKNLPYTIRVEQKGPSLRVIMLDKPKKEEPTDWMTFFCDELMMVFTRGQVLVNPSKALEEFLSGLYENRYLQYKGDDIQRFVKSVYDPFKTTFLWDVKANLTKLLPASTKPTAVLSLTYENAVLQPTLSIQYGEEIIPPNYEEDIVIDPITGKRFQRNRDLEGRFQDQLMGLFTEKDLPFLLQSPADIARFMAELVPILVDRDWIIISNVPEFEVLKDPVELNFSISSSDLNWFEFDPSVSINGEMHNLQEVARMMVDNQGYIKTTQGFVKIATDSQKELEILSKMGAFSRGKQFSPAEIMPLASVAKTQGNTPEAKAFIESIQNVNRHHFCDVSQDFNGTLRDYQQFGVNWMWFLHQTGCGGILADDMGLGKTIQTIALSTQLKEKAPILIIGPTNVTYNWKREIEIFAPDKTVLIYSGPSRKQNYLKNPDVDFIITSFGVIKNDLDLLTEITFKAIIIDEAQYIKNPKAQISQAVKSLNSRFRLALTGTPIENHLQDLWNLFDFVMPGYLGTQNNFDVMMKDGQKDALKIKIKPFVLRREKREVLDSLPEKTEILLKCDMHDEQKNLYKTVLDAAKRGIRNTSGKHQKLNVLTALLKLRQVCLHPGLLKEFEGKDMPSAKFDLAKEKISELIAENHKIVVFSQFTKMLDYMEGWATESGIPLERIDGSVSSKARMEAVERFQVNTEPGLFIISLKAGGVGLNLTAADYVIHLDPWWNPAVESQATDRVHRMGQKNKVIVYKLITEETVEEKIQALQEEKRQLLGEIIDIDQLEDKKIDIKDLQSLLLSN